MRTDSGDSGSTRPRGRVSRPSPDPTDTSALVPIVLAVLVVGAIAFAVVTLAFPKRESVNTTSSAAESGETSADPALDDTTDDAPPSRPPPAVRRDPTARTPTPTPLSTTSEATKLFERDEALLALKPAENRAKSCSDGTLARVRVVVTFGQDGRVQEAKLIDSVGDRSAMAECVLAAFQEPQLKPFRGKPISVVGSVLFDDVE